MENKELQVTIRLTPEVKRRLRIAAAEQNTNMSVLAGNLVKSGLDEYRKQYGLEATEPPKRSA
jgi:predicted transcriptional regulator